jgi:hypothetical protein
LKAILIAAAGELACLVAITLRFRLGPITRRAGMMTRVFLLILPLLIGSHLLLPDDCGFLPDVLVTPSRQIDLAFAIFLYTAGFFGGILQLYNLADRGFSLRIIVDILTSSAGVANVDQIMIGYSAGRGMSWMYSKRLEGMLLTNLIILDGQRIILTGKGLRAARLFSRLQDSLRPESPGLSVPREQ